MYILCLMGFLIILLYCIIIIVKNKEIPNSISQTVYSLSDKWKWMFTIVMFIVGFIIAPQLMAVIKENYEFLGFLTILGILGVGADPLVKNDTNLVHYVSAIVMGISSQLIVLIESPNLLYLWIPYILYTLYESNSDKNMFFAEMVMFLSLGIICLF